MLSRSLFLVAVLAALSACSQPQDSTPGAEPPASAPASAPPANAPAPTSAANDANTPYTPPAPGQPGGLPDDKTPIPEGPIDPKSAQGAAQVAQTYYAFLEQKDYAKAATQWRDPASPNNQTLATFTHTFDTVAQLHANIGAPGDPEGAAGSSYVEVPVQVYGRTTDAKPYNLLGTVTLRRVNDVDGSTAEQRKWHIERIEVKQVP